MIRLTFLLRRKHGQSLEEFQRYWREQHGPLVASFAQRLNILRYVQVHRTETPMNEKFAELRGGMEEPYDGVAELWWESEAKLIEAGGREEGAILVEDEERFIDLQNSPLWFAHEYPQINPLERVVAREFSGVTKLYFALRAPPGMTEEAAQHYWRTAHGPLIRSMAGAGPMLRYMQVHRFESALEQGMRKARGTLVEPYFGHAEAWLDSLRRASGPAAAKQLRRMLEDERKFIDFSRSAAWFGSERYFIDRF